ncbi:annexin a3 [Phtheirospermum japonicum]|uniref:Annexin a3 n=1 Tax=Phtheirospermum japonicum TaxID=374723 RepID=A0A830BMY3_9LAMI|nr:annexin a3 [Phtheirospermum japonicum]
MAISFSRTESICKEIHNSCGDEKSLIQALLNLSQSECRKVRETYLETYGEDLLKLCQKFDPMVSSLSSLMMLSPFERDAVFAREAIHKNDTVNYMALLEIFTCRKSSHVLLILQAYFAKFRSQLELDIASIEPRHPYQKILMALSASHKAHHAEISQHIAKCDARRLYQTGEGKLGAIDEAVVLEIFSKRSISQLKLTFFSYKHIYGHSYTRFLKNQEFGEFEDAVRVVAMCICNPARYYAKVLYGCLKGATTDKGAMARVMVSRAEVDMDEIHKNFKKKYEIELKNVMCESIPQGSYRDLLVAMATKASV